jgi:hypothetical protein
MDVEYTVVRGDCLSRIAYAHGITLAQLLARNPKFSASGRDPDLIYPGEKVIVPDQPTFCSSVDLLTSSVSCGSLRYPELTQAQAQEMFDLLASESHIPFDYPVDCCYTRAHEMCRIMQANGVSCQKYWFFDEHWGTPAVRSTLDPTDASGAPVTFPDPSGTHRPVEWVYHVAPLVKVRDATGVVEDRIMDPSITDGPVSIDEWRTIMGDPGKAYGEISSSDAYFQNSKLGFYQDDPTYTETEKQLDEHRHNRDARLSATGSGP